MPSTDGPPLTVLYELTHQAYSLPNIVHAAIALQAGGNSPLYCVERIRHFKRVLERAKRSIPNTDATKELNEIVASGAVLVESVLKQFDQSNQKLPDTISQDVRQYASDHNTFHVTMDMCVGLSEKLSALDAPASRWLKLGTVIGRMHAVFANRLIGPLRSASVRDSDILQLQAELEGYLALFPDPHRDVWLDHLRCATRAFARNEFDTSNAEQFWTVALDLRVLLETAQPLITNTVATNASSNREKQRYTNSKVWPWKQSEQTLPKVAKHLSKLLDLSVRAIREWSTKYEWSKGIEGVDGRTSRVSRSKVLATVNKKYS